MSDFLYSWRAGVGEVPRSYGTAACSACSSSSNLVETLLAGALGLQDKISVRVLLVPCVCVCACVRLLGFLRLKNHSLLILRKRTLTINFVNHTKLHFPNFETILIYYDSKKNFISHAPYTHTLYTNINNKSNTKALDPDTHRYIRRSRSCAIS